MRPASRSALVILTLALLPALALAAPTYTVSYLANPAGSVSSTAPLERDTTFALPPSWGTAAFIGNGFAHRGHVGGFARIDCIWTTGFSGTYGQQMESRAQATDFLITGPAGPTTVSGTLHLRVTADLDKGGGAIGNDAHGARLVLTVDAHGAAVTGGYFHGNNTSGGDGVLAGVPGPQLDQPFTLSGTFPVGSPFTVTLRMETGGYAYGAITRSPGFVETDAGDAAGDVTGRGLRLEEVGGRVMDLPEGYTLNSESWGVVDNHFGSAVGVGPSAPGGAAGLAVVGPNPTAGEVRFVLSTAHGAHTRVALFDAAGHRVRTFVDGWLPAGRHGFAWDGHAGGGGAAPAGLYFLRAESEGRVETRRIVRIR